MDGQIRDCPVLSDALSQDHLSLSPSPYCNSHIYTIIIIVPNIATNQKLENYTCAILQHTNPFNYGTALCLASMYTYNVPSHVICYTCILAYQRRDPCMLANFYIASILNDPFYVCFMPILLHQRTRVIHTCFFYSYSILIYASLVKDKCHAYFLASNT